MDDINVWAQIALCDIKKHNLQLNQLMAQIVLELVIAIIN
jgi:hypothetical protein